MKKHFTLLTLYLTIVVGTNAQQILALEDPDSSSNSGLTIKALTIGPDNQPLAGLGHSIFKKNSADKWLQQPTGLVQLGREWVAEQIVSKGSGTYAWIPQWRNGQLLQIARWDGSAFVPLSGGNWSGSLAGMYGLAVNTQGTVYSLGRFSNQSTRYALFSYQNNVWDTVVTFADSLQPTHLHINRNNDLFIACNLQNTSRPNRVFRWAGGQLTLLPNTGFAASGAINAMASDSSGNLLVAGSLNKSNGETFVGRWNGTTWTALGAGANQLNADDEIYAIACGKNGWVYAAGAFTQGSTGNAYVARWNGTAWAALGTGANALAANSPIQSVAVDTNNVVYAAGAFTNGQGAQYVARWNGANWAQAGVAVGRNYYRVGNQIEADGAGNLYAAVQRSFDVGSQLIRYQSAAGYRRLDSSEENGISLLHVNRQQQLIVGGLFGSLPTLVARWNGAGYTALNQGALSADATLAWITSGKDGVLYASGDRPVGASGSAGFVHRWTGTAWVNIDNAAQPLNANAALDMAVANDGRFTVFVDSAGATRLKRWTGSQWQSLPVRQFLDGFLHHDTLSNQTTILGTYPSNTRLMYLADTGFRSATPQPVTYTFSAYTAFQRIRDTTNRVVAFYDLDMAAEEPFPSFPLQRFSGQGKQTIFSDYQGIGINGRVSDAAFDTIGNYYFVGDFTNARGFTYIGKLLAPAASVPLPAATLSGIYTTHPQLSWRFQGSTADIATAQLQRSTNGRDFTNIAIVTALQQFTDAYAPANAQRLYYRLLLTSKTDETQHSNIIALSPAAKPLFISISPNPAKDQVVLSSKEPLHNATVQLVNAQGQVVQQWQGLSGQRVVLPFTAAKGQYQLVIRQAGGQEVLPLQVSE